MLIQSQDGYIQLLPALPDKWPTGSFKGLRVRGGAEAAASWSDNRLSSATIKALNDNTFKVKIPGYATTVKQNGKELTAENGYVSVVLKAGQEAKLEFIP